MAYRQGRNEVRLFGYVASPPRLYNANNDETRALRVEIDVYERTNVGTREDPVWDDAKITIPFVAFGKRAGGLSRLLKERDRVFVAGRMAFGPRGYYVAIEGAGSDVIVAGAFRDDAEKRDRLAEAEEASGGEFEETNVPPYDPLRNGAAAGEVS